MPSYLNKGVEKEKIDLLLRAGMAAPSGKDVRPWEFVVVSDRAKLDSCLLYTSCRKSSRIAVLIASQTRSVFNASRIVFPGRISADVYKRQLRNKKATLQIAFSLLVNSHLE